MLERLKNWQTSQLKQATLQPLSFLKIGLLYQKANKEKKTYLYCSSGKRVFSASALLQAIGFKKVIPLSEGIIELKTI